MDRAVIVALMAWLVMDIVADIRDVQSNLVIGE